jgi:hypothetical protein
VSAEDFPNPVGFAGILRILTTLAQFGSSLGQSNGRRFDKKLSRVALRIAPMTLTRVSA